MKKILFFATIAFLHISIGAWWLTRGDRGFPDLSPGSYLGVVDIEGKKSTLFIRRQGDSSRIFAMLFSPGSSPQLPALVRDDGILTGWTSGEGVVIYKPVTISVSSGVYELTGSKTQTGYGGGLKTADGRKGAWSVDLTDFNPFALQTGHRPSDDEILSWLSLKAELRSKKQELNNLNARLGSIQDDFAKLDKLISDRSLVEGRVEQMRSALEAQHQLLSTELKDLEAEVRNRAGELELMKRISKKGRAVELSRRLMARETKWYLANWSPEAESEAMEELLAERQDLDMRKLDKAYRRAAEIERLDKNIAEERAEIERLRRLLAKRRTRSGSSGSGDASWWSNLFHTL